MKMVSTDEMFDRDVITCIQKFKKYNTSSKFQSEQKCGLLHGVINGTGIKQALKRVQQIK